MKKALVSLVAVAALSACSTQTAYIHGQSGTLAKDEMQSFFVGGLNQTKSINAAAVCGGPDKVVKVERTTSFMNGLLNSLSQGIYSPQDAKVYCWR
jgi:Bor protein